MNCFKTKKYHEDCMEYAANNNTDIQAMMAQVNLVENAIGACAPGDIGGCGNSHILAGTPRGEVWWAFTVGNGNAARLVVMVKDACAFFMGVTSDHRYKDVTKRTLHEDDLRRYPRGPSM